MRDLISREAAIDALKALAVPRYKDPACEDMWERDRTLDNAIAVMRDLPSTQPDTPTDTPTAQLEIVRCENCKYCRKVDESEYWCYGICSPARLVRKDDFCSYGCKY